MFQIFDLGVLSKLKEGPGLRSLSLEQWAEAGAPEPASERIRIVPPPPPLPSAPSAAAQEADTEAEEAAAAAETTAARPAQGAEAAAQEAEAGCAAAKQDGGRRQEAAAAAERWRPIAEQIDVTRTTSPMTDYRASILYSYLDS